MQLPSFSVVIFAALFARVFCDPGPFGAVGRPRDGQAGVGGDGDGDGGGGDSRGTGGGGGGGGGNGKPDGEHLPERSWQGQHHTEIGPAHELRSIGISTTTTYGFKDVNLVKDLMNDVYIICLKRWFSPANALRKIAARWKALEQECYDAVDANGYGKPFPKNFDRVLHKPSSIKVLEAGRRLNSSPWLDSLGLRLASPPASASKARAKQPPKSPPGAHHRPHEFSAVAGTTPSKFRWPLP
ncbi:MAG: hypothetical protein M1826_006463 [Phylliscum demangeonii]|nr:MAG: hypothetical protein M1826_006463 [Phylliscum demangeonii]